MTLTKKRQKILLIALPAAVIVIAAAVLWLMLGRGAGEKKSFEILRDQTTGEILGCVLQEGSMLGDITPPLDLYSFTPPEHWVHIHDAAATANQFSVNYLDDYLDETNTMISFQQQPAYRQDNIESPESLQEIQFGDRQVMYFQDENTYGEIDQTKVYWIHDRSLLSFTYQKDATVSEMLELIRRVDYESDRAPVYSPLTLKASIFIEPAEQVSSEFDLGTYHYRSEGNPEIPEQVQLLSFPKPPEGYALTKESSDLEDEFGNYTYQSRYENSSGEVLQLDCYAGKHLFFACFSDIDYPFSSMSYEELGNPDSIQNATVKGNPAFVHINEDVSEIGWIDGYCTLQLRCTAPMTAEQLIALAETVE